MKASEEKRSDAEGAEKSENGASTRLTLWQAGAQQAAPLPIQTRMQQHGCGLSVCGHGMPCPYQTENNSMATAMGGGARRSGTEPGRKCEEKSFTCVRGFRMTKAGLAHAGYYYCYVVGLFGCAGPLFCCGY